MTLLDLLPDALDLMLYVGDDPIVEIEMFEDDEATTLSDLTGYDGWAATVRSGDGQTAALTVDSSAQADSVIAVIFDGDAFRGFQSKNTRWDLQALDPQDRKVTLCRGKVSFTEDVTP